MSFDAAGFTEIRMTGEELEELVALRVEAGLVSFMIPEGALLNTAGWELAKKMVNLFGSELDKLEARLGKAGG